MRKLSLTTRRARALGMIASMGTLCQFGGCELGTITTTTTMTIDARDVIIQIARGAILTPIDAFITNAVNEVFDSND
jgi:hypothetical protein